MEPDRFSMPEHAGKRLDVALSMRLGVSRSRVQEMIRRGLVTVDGRAAGKDHRITGREELAVFPMPCEATELEPAEIPLRVIYRDGDIAVISKQAGLVVHPAAGHRNDTLVNALLGVLPDIGAIGGELRPGIVHRLDRDTSGLLVVARNDASMERLQGMIRRREVKREYLALVHGALPGVRGTIDAPVGRDPHNRKRMKVIGDGKPSLTHYRVREICGPCTLVEVELETGRTHQIRVHFSYIGHPVVGDRVYGRGEKDLRELGLERQFLHAWRLTFPHPATGETMKFEDPLPEDLQAALERVRFRGES